jgi:hypothetical protein
LQYAQKESHKIPFQTNRLHSALTAPALFAALNVALRKLHCSSSHLRRNNRPRQRIYLETMERVLGGTDKTIIDTGGRSSPGVVPYLPLTSLPRERPTQQHPSTGGSQ